MANSNLCVVGTCHDDPDGESRLTYILERLMPNVVAVELSKDRDCSDILSFPEKTPQEEEKETDQILMECGLALNPIQRKTLIEACSLAKEYFNYEGRASSKYIGKNPNFKLEYIDLSVYGNGKESFAEGYKGVLSKLAKDVFQIPEMLKPF